MTQTEDQKNAYNFYKQIHQKARGIHILQPTGDEANLNGEQTGIAGPSGTNTNACLACPQNGPAAAPERSAQPSCPTMNVYDTEGHLTTPTWPGGDDTVPKSFEDIGRGSTSQNNEQHLCVNVTADDAYSDASERFRANRSLHEARNWANRQGYGSDSDKSDEGKAKGGDDDVYDSDLDSKASQGGVRPSREHARKMWKWKSVVTNRFENMMLECVVNIDDIPPRYENMFIAASIIQQLERVTKRSMERVKAYNHGVLKGNRITGALLWGPPGTGKSLLAKGLARESGYNMIAISTAEIWQKCHGEDEKVIKAVFSMGRKLHPCIIFIDEADAMLGARKAGEKRHLRSMLNQFLLEWDGLTSGLRTPFILLATNRPFDLDPAVLRRAPVHIKMDVPRQEDRRQILQLLLRGESFRQDKDSVISQLARITPNYTGSDLKSLCVTAASLCVDEQDHDTDERFLTEEHFRRAMETVRSTALNSTMKNEFQKFGRERENEEE